MTDVIALNDQLREAAREDREADVARLLAAGADPHAQDGLGETPFNAAAANAPKAGRLMTLHWLAGKTSLGLDDTSGSHGSTLAQYMAKWLGDDEFKKEIARGMKIDVPNKSGWTPLTAAAAMGRVAVVTALVEKYAKPALYTQTTEDYTAVYNGHSVTYVTGLNAFEVAKERMLQDEGLSEDEVEALWECADIIAAAIQA